MENEILEIVDNNGKFLRRARRSTTYKKGLLHKAVNILIFNEKGQLFLQKRSGKKSSYPYHWDISCCEHVKPEESYKKAAQRGLKEELNIFTKIKKIRNAHRQKSVFIKDKEEIIENELVVLYGGVYNGKIEIRSNEVAKGKFLTLKEVNSLLLGSKIKFTPWAKDELEFFTRSENNTRSKLFP